MRFGKVGGTSPLIAKEISASERVWAVGAVVVSGAKVTP